MRTGRFSVILIVLALCLVVTRLSTAAERPMERVSPAPKVNRKAAVWRTPEPPSNPQAGDVWVNAKDGMEMVYVSPGEFVLGTSDAQIEAWLKEHPRDKREWFAEERPQCRVSLSGYWIGRTEVTNAQYLRFVRATGHRAPEHWKQGQIPSGLERFPVVFVDWEDARAYCEWTGGHLPSELEWEKAARGTDGRLFPWGSEWEAGRCRSFEVVLGSDIILFGQSAADVWPSALSLWARDHDMVRDGPAAVGGHTARASPYGCLDMAGNVWEWTADGADKDAYRRYAQGDLTPPASGTYNVLRGGSWVTGLPELFRCADRDGAPSGHRHAGLGFRCARSAGPVASALPSDVQVPTAVAGGRDESAHPLPASGSPAGHQTAGPTPGSPIQQRPAERASPIPEVNLNAVVWRTPEPPSDPQAGDVWVNPTDQMEMLYVPAGEFLLGTSDAQVETWLRQDPEGKPEWYDNERPQCRPRLGAYWTARTPVTNAHYLRFVQVTGHAAPKHWQDARPPSGTENLPVVNVSWDDARAYSEWAGGRLLTELEWEKAARGPDGRIFPWDEEWDSTRCYSVEAVTGERYSSTVEWFLGLARWQKDHGQIPDLTAVGRYPAGASPYGCMDMAGSLIELCADWYDPNAYRRYAAGDLSAPSAGKGWVVRGSYWMLSLGEARNFRCTQRGFDSCTGYDTLGFRYARDPGAARSPLAAATSPRVSQPTPLQQAGVPTAQEQSDLRAVDASAARYESLTASRKELLEKAGVALKHAADLFLDGAYSSANRYTAEANGYTEQAAALDAPRGEALRAVVGALGSPSVLVRRRVADRLLSLARKIDEAFEWNTFDGLGVLSALRDRAAQEDDGEAKDKEKQAADYIAEHMTKSQE